ncbi:MAG: formate dehydrogenase accessory protein FdhE [Gammaproteobacteria bacterium]|nr:formate dehydrogenase accessory protein FdhE [Gammaproteobacteria bacterium]
MPRILEPGQIESLAQGAIPRVRLPQHAGPFRARAERLRQLAAPGAIGHAIGDYLKLMAVVVEAQAAAAATVDPRLPDATELGRARTHRMPPIEARGWARQPLWRVLGAELAERVAGAADIPDQARHELTQVRSLPPEWLEGQADALLSGRREDIEMAVAPFVMASLQTYWVALASRLTEEVVPPLEVPGLCPACGSLPVASVVRVDRRSQGHRYLHCGLCATEWHLVRVTCSHCQNTEGIAYHSIEGGPDAIRAESCEHCHIYRKILYQEQDAGVEPVADDLASLPLDLLMGEAGYQRGSGNPLLWQ